MMTHLSTVDWNSFVNTGTQRKVPLCMLHVVDTVSLTQPHHITVYITMYEPQRVCGLRNRTHFSRQSAPEKHLGFIRRLFIRHKAKSSGSGGSDLCTGTLNKIRCAMCMSRMEWGTPLICTYPDSGARAFKCHFEVQMIYLYFYNANFFSAAAAPAEPIHFYLRPRLRNGQKPYDKMRFYKPA